METSIEKIVQDSKLNGKSALLVQDAFIPLLQSAVEKIEIATTINVVDETDTATMKRARELRLKLRDVRIEADKKRKELKEDALKYGNAVQNAFNAIKQLIEPAEYHLDKQERYAEIKAAEERARLKARRDAECAPFVEFLQGVDLASLEEGVYEMMLNAAKSKLEQKQEQERLEELERQERLRAEAEERERIKKENERLRAEAAAREKELKEEREKLQKIEAEKIALEQKKEQVAAELTQQPIDEDNVPQHTMLYSICTHFQCSQEEAISKSIRFLYSHIKR